MFLILKNKKQGHFKNRILNKIIHIELLIFMFTENREMNEFRLYITNFTYVGSINGGDVLCYRDTDPGYPNVIQQKTCNVPARTFAFVNRRPDDTAIIELCHIEIIGKMYFISEKVICCSFYHTTYMKAHCFFFFFNGRFIRRCYFCIRPPKVIYTSF